MLELKLLDIMNIFFLSMKEKKKESSQFRIKIDRFCLTISYNNSDTCM